MIHRKQAGYDNFRCIADKCPKSCCEGWQIVIDEDSLSKYQQHTGSFAERLQSGVDFREGVFRQNHRLCSMLASGGLCDLQSTLGEPWLCNTCRQYPRHIEEYLDLREYSLSLSCPEAVHMLLDPNFRFELTESEDDRVDDPDEFDDFDIFLFDSLTYAREKMMEIISDHSLPLQDRINRVIFLSRQLQELYDQGEIFEMDAVFDINPIFDADSVFDTNPVFDHMKSHEVCNFMLQSLDVLLNLEVLEDSWTEMINRSITYWRENTADFNQPADASQLYASAEHSGIDSKHPWLQTMYPDEELSLIYEKVFQSLFFSYFCGSIYDGQIYARTMIAAMSVRWIMMIHRANPHLSLAEAIYLYSREVEHSDPNVNALISYFEKDLDE